MTTLTNLIERVDELRVLAYRVENWDGADLAERNKLNDILHDMRPEPKVVQSQMYMADVNDAIEWCEAMLSWKDDSAHGIVDEAHATIQFRGYRGDRIYAPQLATAIMHAAVQRLAALLRSKLSESPLASEGV